jgi:hypothetical protein
LNSTAQLSCVDWLCAALPTLRRHFQAASFADTAEYAAKAYPRHCERSEAIHASRAKERMDCFVASAPRNDGERSFAISPQVCARFDLEFSAF